MDEATFKTYYPKIYNYVYYRVLNKATAEDITGIVFFKALESAASYDGTRASYATWLFTIARNAVNNFFRDSKSAEPLEDLDIPAGDRSLDDTLIMQEETRRLYSLLRELPDRERTVLALRFWGELSYKEISASTGLSVSNIGVIISRTLKKLKTLW